MANQEKNKYQDEILIKQIEEFVAHLSVEKNYALNTVSAYKRDLLKFLSFLGNKNISDWAEVDGDTVNLFVMGLRHGDISNKSLGATYLQYEFFIISLLITKQPLQIQPYLFKLLKSIESFQKLLILMI